ncbi:hypothetical protein PGT21_050095 [Puccinia graminis f. sp. tritici]|uniref:Uncharacterized protein n=1 Tax=Puccinia graminis f. sp. tritici TaxID=56615 RepID=A0A5B0MAK9_PUCGR|nr:hypothetical protein PGT21_050095 [Puccinia graminis f. sp. tritici]
MNTLNTYAPTGTSNEEEEIVEAIAGLFIQPRLEYDSSRFCKLATWHHVSPAVTLVKLKTALFYVTQTCSLYTSSCMLKLDRQLIELVTTQGLKHQSQPQPLSISSQLALSDLPQDTRTVIRNLSIDPDLEYLVCCPDCFAMYPETSATPNRCSHRLLPKEKKSSNPDETDDSVDNGPMLCGAELFRHSGATRSPIRKFAYQNLVHWLARLFCRKDIEEALEETAIKSRSPYDSSAEMFDIQDSQTWREFRGADGNQFTSDSGNVVFGMFMDGINPYGNRQAGKHVSVTFIVMICLSLPVSLRYRPENIFLVGIAPGPKEPSLEQTNWILGPVVEQLKSVWYPGMKLSKTPLHPQGRSISAALLPFFADLPALRRSLGFASHAATRMCSCCLLPKSDISNINEESWPPRTLDQHKFWAKKSYEAESLDERDEILLEHGVRYSVLLELPYWDILKFHVVDAMHNLLLGLLKWHCQRFWLMSDEDDEQAPKGVSTKELRDLIAAASSPLPHDLSSTLSQLPSTSKKGKQRLTEDTEVDQVAFRDLLLGNSSTSSDDDFVPHISSAEWGGEWVAPSEGKIIFDKTLISHVNSLLSKIRIPTWIQRAIPVLGKASFGRLKADEWRNLFTVQLPLILPSYWNDDDPACLSLLHNFAHLVSLVNLGLKRSMTAKRADDYREHVQAYIQSSLTLFPDVELAPNHHMAFHLARCLKALGPSRAWWSFSMERLMAQVLKSTGNNQLGQMEITYQKTFGRISNLRSMLESGSFPPSLDPVIRQIKALYDPIPAVPRTRLNEPTRPLSEKLFKQLIIRLNERFPLATHKWLESDKWVALSSAESPNFAPVNSRAEHVKNIHVDDVIFSTISSNESNCAIALKPHSPLKYGLIHSIFKHTRRAPGLLNSITDTWVVVHPLVPIPTVNDPYKGFDKYHMTVALRRINNLVDYIIPFSDILAHCAWLRYPAGTVHQTINYETIALVCIDR